MNIMDHRKQRNCFGSLNKAQILTVESCGTSFIDFKETCTTTPNRFFTEQNNDFTPDIPHKKRLSGYLNQKQIKSRRVYRGTCTDDTLKSYTFDNASEGALKFQISISPKKEYQTRNIWDGSHASFVGRREVNPLSKTMNLSTVRFQKLRKLSKSKK